LDTANKGAEVVVHLSIKGKGSSQSEHLHLSVYVQEDPSAICIMPMARMPDAQVHFFFFITCYHQQENWLQRERYAATSITTYHSNAGGSAQSFRI
jgi:hypothetical protein